MNPKLGSKDSITKQQEKTRRGQLSSLGEEKRKKENQISFRQVKVETSKWKHRQAVVNVGVEKRAGVRTRGKDLKDFGMRNAGLDSPQKVEEQEAEDKNLGTCPLMRQSEEVKEQ